MEAGRSNMGIRTFLRSSIHTLRLSRKSDRTEFFLYLRLVLLGLVVVGTVGFIIQFVASYLKVLGG